MMVEYGIQDEDMHNLDDKGFIIKQVNNQAEQACRSRLSWGLIWDVVHLIVWLFERKMGVKLKLAY